MKKFIAIAGVVLALAGCQKAIAPNEETAVEQEKTIERVGNDEIKIERPLANEVITSPLMVQGEVRGYWMFEATFHMRLEDMDGNEIASTPIMSSGDWMTEDFVPFEGTLNFSSGDATEGKLIFMQHDASGPDEGPEPKSFEMPVRFSE